VQKFVHYWTVFIRTAIASRSVNNIKLSMMHALLTRSDSEPL